MILKSLGIAIKQVDISAPGMDEQRDFMRASAKKKEGQRHALPPQIFNGEKYCGDYDDFDVANEDDELKEHLLKEHQLKAPLLKKLQLMQHLLKLLLLKKLQLMQHLLKLLL